MWHYKGNSWGRAGITDSGLAIFTNTLFKAAGFTVTTTVGLLVTLLTKKQYLKFVKNAFITCQ